MSGTSFRFIFRLEKSDGCYVLKTDCFDLKAIINSIDNAREKAFRTIKTTLEEMPNAKTPRYHIFCLIKNASEYVTPGVTK